MDAPKTIHSEEADEEDMATSEADDSEDGGSDD
jgi:hypothetical protein